VSSTPILYPPLNPDTLISQGARLVVQLRSAEKVGRCFCRRRWSTYSSRELTDAALRDIIKPAQDFRVTERGMSGVYFTAHIEETVDSSD
jgi:hypothetical protein